MIFRIFIFAVYLCFGFAVAAQTATIKSSVNKTRILIGEPIELTIEIRLPQDQPARALQPDSIPHFEILGAGDIDTLPEGEAFIIREVYRITSFDSGHWSIPSFMYAKNIFTDSIGIDVDYSPFDRSQDYHDIKDIIEVEEAPIKHQWWWYVAAAGAVLLLLVIYLLTRKKAKPQPGMPSTVDPYSAAVADLKALSQQKPGTREFHDRLVEIFRIYVFRKKGILSLQKTTDDIVLQVKDLVASQEKFARMAQALRLSDMVKFARFEPSDADNNAALEAIRDVIDSLEHKPENR